MKKTMKKAVKTMFAPSFDGKGMDTIYIGFRDDIRAMYKCIDRAYRNNKTDICPMVSGHIDDKENFVKHAPIFNPHRSVYGLCIDNHGLLTIIEQDVIASWMFSVMGDQITLDLD